jgi:hypothetical protein
VRRIAAPIVAAGLAAAILSPAHAHEEASRTFDRTFSCEAGYVGGLYRVNLGSAYSTSPGSSALVATSSVTRDLWDAPLGQMSSEGVTVHRRLCVPAKSTVKLTTKGLRGGLVPPLGAESTCETPRRLLLRVRAAFERPVTPQTVKPFGFPILSATGELERAALAVGTRAGKTLAYLSLTGAGKARLFTQRTCKEG